MAFNFTSYKCYNILTMKDSLWDKQRESFEGLSLLGILEKGECCMLGGLAMDVTMPVVETTELLDSFSTTDLEYRGYVIHILPFGNYNLFYTINDERKKSIYCESFIKSRTGSES